MTTYEDGGFRFIERRPPREGELYLGEPMAFSWSRHQVYEAAFDIDADRDIVERVS